MQDLDFGDEESAVPSSLFCYSPIEFDPNQCRPKIILERPSFYPKGIIWNDQDIYDLLVFERGLVVFTSEDERKNAEEHVKTLYRIFGTPFYAGCQSIVFSAQSTLPRMVTSIFSAYAMCIRSVVYSQDIREWQMMRALEQAYGYDAHKRLILFHGTSLSIAQSIVSKGGGIRCNPASTKCSYGKGIHFTRHPMQALRFAHTKFHTNMEKLKASDDSFILDHEGCHAVKRYMTMVVMVYVVQPGMTAIGSSGQEMFGSMIDASDDCEKPVMTLQDKNRNYYVVLRESQLACIGYMTVTVDLFEFASKKFSTGVETWLWNATQQKSVDYCRSVLQNSRKRIHTGSDSFASSCKKEKK